MKPPDTKEINGVRAHRSKEVRTNDVFPRGGQVDVEQFEREGRERSKKAAAKNRSGDRVDEPISGVEIVRADTITPRPITWIWPGWLARGKLHIAAGSPGTGKSSVAFALAATVTCGGRFPDGSRATSGNVMIWSGEDDHDDTIVPRLIASGADCSRVHILRGVLDEDGQRRPFNPALDVPRLRDAVRRIDGGVALLIVDPIVSAVLGDSHKNAEVRRGLQPLVDLAADIGAAVIGISHFSKATLGRDPVERVTGSIAFGALARIVFAVAKMPESEGGGRVICRSKSNIGADHGGFRFHLDIVEVDDRIAVTAVRWSGAIDGTARRILAQAEASQDDQDQRPELDDAKEFLRHILADGDLPSKQVRTDAEGAGHSWATVRRAQKELGIEPYKDGMTGGWMWTITPREYPEIAEDTNVEWDEHLRGKMSIFGTDGLLAMTADEKSITID